MTPFLFLNSRFLRCLSLDFYITKNRGKYVHGDQTKNMASEQIDCPFWRSKNLGNKWLFRVHVEKDIQHIRGKKVTLREFVSDDAEFLHFSITTRMGPHWRWADYHAEWAVSKNRWRSNGILLNLFYLWRFGIT